MYLLSFPSHDFRLLLHRPFFPCFLPVSHFTFFLLFRAPFVFRQCAFGCKGTRCAAGCVGVQCGANCQGEYCAEGCSGANCNRGCQGNGCDKKTTTTATATTITSTASTASATTTTTTTTTTTISPCQGWAASDDGDGDNTGETNVWGNDDGDGNSDVSYAAVGDGWCSHGTSESTGKGAKVTPYRIQAWTKDWSIGLSSCKSYCSKDKYCIGVTHYSKEDDCYIHSCRAPKTNVWTLVSEENDGEKGKEYPADVRAITMASKEFFKDVDPGKKEDEKKMQCHRRILPTTTATTTTTTVTASTTTTTTTADNCVLGDRVWADASGFGNEDTKWASNITVLPPSPQTTLTTPPVFRLIEDPDAVSGCHVRAPPIFWRRAPPPPPPLYADVAHHRDDVVAGVR